MVSDLIIGIVLVILSVLSWLATKTLFEKLRSLNKKKKHSDSFYENTIAGITAALIIFLLQRFVDSTTTLSTPSIERLPDFLLGLLAFLINIVFVCSVTLLGVLFVFYVGKKWTRN